MSTTGKTRDRIEISADHPAFAGHFPGMPIVPGVVLLDAALASIGRSRSMPCACGELASAKFHSPVAPGESLCVEHEISAAGSIRFTLHAGERLVATAVWKPA
jgi:3-hydroxymyristoyl/3-hydroxydecanoyl-(acyl carrier protein) dehydratase